MPVTAKLSRAFYAKLGDDVASELVDWFNTVELSYRAEIREMFETHFSRFEARLAQLSAELRAEMAQVRAENRNDLAVYRAEFSDRMSQLESRMVRLMFRYWLGSVAATIGVVWGARQLHG